MVDFNQQAILLVYLIQTRLSKGIKLKIIVSFVQVKAIYNMTNLCKYKKQMWYIYLSWDFANLLNQFPCSFLKKVWRATIRSNLKLVVLVN